MILKNIVKSTLALAVICYGTISSAQPGTVIEKIVAVIGEDIILKSDIDKEIEQYKLQMPTEFEGDLGCEVFRQLVLQKMLLQKAAIDSIHVGDERVDYEIDRRIDYFAAQAGGLQELEKYLKMKIVQYKAMMREQIKNQMLIEQARESLLSGLKVSPTEVRKFYDDIPSDSLPNINAEVEIAQIVIKPKASKYAEDYAFKAAVKLRKQIMDSTIDFCTAATLYSDDPGTKEKCGRLGEFTRGKMVPEFEGAVYKLKKDSFSEVIKTDFGYHIIQLLSRKGEIIDARHVLIRPKILKADHTLAKRELSDLVVDIKNGVLTLCDATKKFSEDEQTKANCGYFTDANLGTNKIEVTNLEPTVALQIENLKAGEFSNPVRVAQQDGSIAYRVLYLKTEIPPHKADLSQDYHKLSVYALEKKKQDVVKNWAKEYKENVYIKIGKEYSNCSLDIQ
jgi:peptidyl-prolyl cis-trans isomerase SurA